MRKFLEKISKSGDEEGEEERKFPEISQPYDFKHEKSIGWNQEEGVFYARGIPKEWVENLRINMKFVPKGDCGQVFGRPLEEVVPPGGGIPKLVEQCIKYLEQRGLKEPGIFRETGSLETVRGYKEILDNGGSVDLTKEKDPHVVSTLLKLFLRSLPEPICTFELYSQFLEAGALPEHKQRVERLKRLVNELPDPNYKLLKNLVAFLTRLQDYSLENRMEIHNIATIFGPTMLVDSNLSTLTLVDDIPKINTVIKIFLEDFAIIFMDKEIQDQKAFFSATASAEIPLNQSGTIYPLEELLKKLNFTEAKAAHYAKLLFENDISEDLLPDLNHELLMQIGITSVGDRIQILKLAQKTQKSSSAVGEELDINITGDIKLQKELGVGAFSTVYLGLWDGTPVACKKLESFEFESFKREAKILTKLKHPHIVSYLGIWKSQDMYYIITEYLPLGSLHQLLLSSPDLSLKDIVSVAKGAAAGMSYLHQRDILHRDLAARNLLVTTEANRYIVKVADFGLSKSLYGEDFYVSSNKKFARKWAAPEALKFLKFSKASDVWSYGVTLWEIFEKGQVPYADLDTKEAVEAIIGGRRLSKPKNCPDNFYNLMMACWRMDPAERPTFIKIVQELQEFLPKEDSDTSSGEDTNVEGLASY